MKKIIVSIIVTGLLLNIAPFSIGGEEASEMPLSDGSKPLSQVPSDDSSYMEDEMLYGELEDKPEFVSGEMIIKFKDNLDLSISLSSEGFLNTDIPSIDILNDQYGVTSAEQIFRDHLVSSLSNVYKLTFTDEVDVPSVAAEYSRDSGVVYAEPNYIYYTCDLNYDPSKEHSSVFLGTFPNDPFLNQQWALHNTGQTGGTSDADIDAPEAWDIETGSSDVIIAVIDSGVVYNHPDLEDNIWINDDEIPNNGIDDDNNGYIDDIRGWNFLNNDSDPMDDWFHGTHCAGIASAVTNNGVGVSGICWNCCIMPLKVSSDKPSDFSLDAAAEAIVYATDNNADVISMSWGSFSNSQLIQSVIDDAYNQDVVLVAAAGNDRFDLEKYPAAYDNVIAVASTDHNDVRASSSSYGEWVDVAAPGVEIYSTTPLDIQDGYATFSGTSMACPHVSGLAALLLSYNPSLNNDMIKTIISNSVDEINSDKYIGRGRINAHKALITEPAVAILNSFSNWRDITGNMDITGKVWCESFQYFILEYGRGKNPDSWTQIINSPIAINGTLASLNTNNLDDGFYIVRLKVVCDSNTYIDIIKMVVNKEKNVIYVDDDNSNGPWDGTIEHPYRYIQDGIYDTGIGDEVYVHSGIYNENIFLYGSINLTGENRSNTIIKGHSGTGSKVVLITVNYINMNEFTVTGSPYGIYLIGGYYNIIYRNTIKLIYCGLKLRDSSNNVIYQNNFVKNYYSAEDYGNNMWDNGTFGNYWDDYTGEDNDGDGIGDTPYHIPEGDNEDRYPLMEPWGGNDAPFAPTLDGPTNGKAGTEYEYTFNAVDPNNDEVRYFIDWGDGRTKWTDFHSSGTDVKVKHTWSETGNYTIKAKARDIFDAESEWGYLEVTMPKNQNSQSHQQALSPLFLRLLEKVANQFPLLERMFNLQLLKQAYICLP